MDDEFLYRLRKRPPPEFAARLKARLDRRAAAPRGLPPGSRFVQGLAAAVLIGAAAAFAAMTVSMHGFFAPPDDPARAPEGASVVQQAGDPAGRGAAGEPPVPQARQGRPAPRNAGGGSAGSAKPTAPPAPPAAGATAGSSGPQGRGAAATAVDTAVDRAARSDTWPRDHVAVAASPAAYPYTLAVAQSFARSGFPQPEVALESMPDDLRRLCDYTSLGPPDLLVRLGRMSSAESAACPANRTGDLVEIKVGYASVVFARSNAYGAFALSPRELFVALAAEFPDPDDPERLIDNPYRLWSDADPGLPYDPIEVVGPELDSPLGRAFVALALEAGCNTFAELAALKEADPPRYERVCRGVRDDGAYVEMQEGFDFMQRIETYPAVLGVFSYDFYQRNGATLDAAPVAGVEPTLASFDAGTYAASRPLYLYLKKRHLRLVSSLAGLVDRYAATPPAFGLVPLNEAERRDVRAEVLELTPSTR